MSKTLDSTLRWSWGVEGRNSWGWVIIALPAICWELEEVRRKAEVPVCLRARGGMRSELSILRGFGRPDDGTERRGGRGVGEERKEVGE